MERPSNLKHLHTNVELKESGIGGLGLFATGLIRQGEIVWEDTEFSTTTRELKTSAQVMEMDPSIRTSWIHFSTQVEEDLFEGTSDSKEAMKDAAFFWNHSCDPNTWFNNDTQMEAIRDIQPGEELTFDYATFQTFVWPEEIRRHASPQTIKCLCGTKACRGKVSGDDWKLPELRRKYAGHFIPYIQAMMDKEKEQ
jgi:SET domain-containing protein